MKTQNLIHMLAVIAFAGCGIPDPEEALPDGGGHGSHPVDAAPDSDGEVATVDAAPQPTSGEATIDASSTTDWVRWSFAAGAVVSVDDPAASTAWDLAIRRTQLATSSGTSGAGQGGAVDTTTTDWAAVTECPADGYQVDAMLPLPGPPDSGEYSGNPVLNGWYDYDPVTHAVSSKGLVYCVRTATGNFAKLGIVNYGSGQMTIRWTYQPDGSPTFP